MAIPLLETLGDLLSASSGALVGAIVTGLFNRGRNRTLTNQVMASQRELEKQQMENARLLDVIKDRENMIIKMQVQMLANDDDKDAPAADKKSESNAASKKTTKKRRK